ncbi:MAG: BamA/TamA family outer membrane protein [Gemmatimonadaceae bacterium]|nr:BamA/TamA family outer membrane protein [Gemmatimonadaceae bacterium]
MRQSSRQAIVTCALGATWILSAALVTPLTAQRADSTTRSDSVGRRRIQPLPALASAPETGLQYGATVLAVWEPAAYRKTRPSSLTASALRTAKAQTRIRLEGERWTRGNAQRITGSLQWQEFPLPYYGVGDRTPKAAEETFTPKGTEAIVTLQQRIARSWYLSAGARHLEQRITTDSTGALGTQPVTGNAGGTMTEWSTGLLTDTRDNLFSPHAGDWIQLTYARSVQGAWSDYSYGTLKLDARSYRTIGTGHVLATQLQLTNVDGTAPFDQLALVGSGDILRGYARGRYRDRAMAAWQGEYRTPIRHRLGAVAFVGAGSVSPTLNGIISHRLLPTYGAGLRVEIDHRQRTGVRADYGRGRDGASGLYIGFNNAF